MLIFSMLIFSALNKKGGVIMECGFGFGPLMGRAAHLGRERMDARMSQYDVTPTQNHTLFYLQSHGGQAPQCEIMEYLRVKPSTANGILDRMEEKKLVSRSVSGSDARRRLITITEKGIRLSALCARCVQEGEAVMLRGFTPKETETLHALLCRVIQNLEEDRNL